MKTVTKLWIGIVILAVLSPIGILIPQFFKAGDAWGEWGLDTLRGMVGYVPKGIAKISQVWKAPMPDYAIEGSSEKGLFTLSFSYIFSALTGILIVATFAFLLAKSLSKKEKKKPL